MKVFDPKGRPPLPEVEVVELEEALRLIREGKVRSAYRVFGKVILEVPLEEAERTIKARLKELRRDLEGAGRAAVNTP